MGKEKNKAAKLIVYVDVDGTRHWLFSRKRAKNEDSKKHDKLELLGGGFKKKESPWKALKRELKKEEKSGKLRKAVKAAKPDYVTVEVDDTAQCVYEIEITLDQYGKLKHRRKESFGFELIPETRVSTEEFHRECTDKTRGILAATRA